MNSQNQPPKEHIKYPALPERAYSEIEDDVPTANVRASLVAAAIERTPPGPQNEEEALDLLEELLPGVIYAGCSKTLKSSGAIRRYTYDVFAIPKGSERAIGSYSKNSWAECFAELRAELSKEVSRE